MKTKKSATKTSKTAAKRRYMVVFRTDDGKRLAALSPMFANFNRALGWANEAADIDARRGVTPKTYEVVEVSFIATATVKGGAE